MIITTADSAAFAESYRGLWGWAWHHGLSGFWAAAFPLQVDTFIIVGGLALFVAAVVDQWERRHKAGAWAVTLLGLAASVAGNIGHIAAHDLQSRGTAAVSPVAAFAAMWIGLSALKRVIAQADGTVLETAPEPGARQDEEDTRDQLPALVPSPVPSDAESAAVVDLWATLATGNPLSLNQLQTRFRLTRKEATDVHHLVFAGVNGHAGTGSLAPLRPVPDVVPEADEQSSADREKKRQEETGPVPVRRLRRSP